MFSRNCDSSAINDTLMRIYQVLEEGYSYEHMGEALMIPSQESNVILDQLFAQLNGLVSKKFLFVSKCRLVQIDITLVKELISMLNHKFFTRDIDPYRQLLIDIWKQSTDPVNQFVPPLRKAPRASQPQPHYGGNKRSVQKKRGHKRRTARTKRASKRRVACKK